MSENIKRIDQSLPAQRKRVLDLLKAGPMTTYDFRRIGISNPSARIGELIQAGHLFGKSRVTCVDSDGFAHPRVARYERLASPSLFDGDEGAPQ